jgi:predicted RNA-binding protein (virulence factor B family)
MKTFNVTFTDDSDKYSPTTRTVSVNANDETHAELLVHSRFGTFTKAEGLEGLKKDIFVPSEKHIHINKVKEVKEKKGKK